MTQEPTLERVVEKLAAGPSLLEMMGLERGDLDAFAIIARKDFLAGKDEDAVSKFARLVMADPTNADYQLGLAETALATGRAETAMQSAALVIAERPTSPVGYFLSGRAAMLMGEVEFALEDLGDAIKFAEASGDAAILASARQYFSLVKRD